jgi:hypothetical protein|tara:strand:- start:222 stop:734 length:513 start_codon:yes stop_codon:yes gene_type:complete
MDSTTSYIKVYDITPEMNEDFEFDFTTDGNDLLGELVPNLQHWEDIGWAELQECEYSPHKNTLHLVIETKWDAPVRWLKQASCDTVYFENKLITMTTIQKDETCVTGVAVMDGEILQKKEIWSMEAEMVGKYYNDEETHYDLDDLDNQIWDAIGQFVGVCEKFYRPETGA